MLLRSKMKHRQNTIIRSAIINQIGVGSWKGKMRRKAKDHPICDERISRWEGRVGCWKGKRRKKTTNHPSRRWGFRPWSSRTSLLLQPADWRRNWLLELRWQVGNGMTRRTEREGGVDIYTHNKVTSTEEPHAIFWFLPSGFIILQKTPSIYLALSKKRKRRGCMPEWVGKNVGEIDRGKSTVVARWSARWLHGQSVAA